MATRLSPGGYPVASATVGTDASADLTAVSGATTAETLTAKVELALNGAPAAVTVSTIAAEIEIDLSGVSATASADSVIFSGARSVSIVGVTATTLVANFLAQIDFSSGTKVTGKGKKAANISTRGVLRITLDDVFRNDTAGLVGAFGVAKNSLISAVVTPTSAAGLATSFEIDFQVDENGELAGIAGTGNVAAIPPELSPALAGVTADGNAAEFSLLISPDTALDAVISTGDAGALAANINDGTNTDAGLPIVFAIGSAESFSILLDIYVDDSAVQGRTGEAETGDPLAEIDIDIADIFAAIVADDFSAEADAAIELAAAVAIGDAVAFSGESIHSTGAPDYLKRIIIVDDEIRSITVPR